LIGDRIDSNRHDSYRTSARVNFYSAWKNAASEGARRHTVLCVLLLLVACTQPAPEPEVVPQTPPTPANAIGIVRVTATTLNVRDDASASGKVIAQVKRGDQLTLLGEQSAWSHVRLASGEEGWVASQHVTSGKKKKPGCDSDFAFVKAPLASFSESGPHGLVIVDATVNTKGEVISTKVVSNSTGEKALATMAEREIRSATFKPPYRDCQPRAFIFTYKRSF